MRGPIRGLYCESRDWGCKTLTAPHFCGISVSGSTAVFQTSRIGSSPIFRSKMKERTMSERKEVRIDEVEGGYIVNLEYAWKERPKDEKVPEDRRIITSSLNKALAIAKKHLSEK